MPIFAKIEPAKLKLLAFTSERMNFAVNQELCHQGDPGDAMYVILGGVADILIDSSGGQIKVAELKRNDFGAGEYLLTSSAIDGWTPWLLYARGELYRRRGGPGDFDKAIGFYNDALAKGGDLPEILRGRGLAEIKNGALAAGKADLAEYLHRAPDADDHSLIAMMAGGTA